ncbi:hypothetical protein CC1G_01605 [Coprinopsis cinerea okayama7|uniref:F-box domain-containing protein n=1 Tax=Coprinopsis cinerea (strain Okayama-7 / 130 / ATCC MYA-4618 / FGSC 9003) TaxID=240176 RepID=A8NI77_COPC7|nr:hypothetical protein CC1G_01605 [Coprinopsis cinerea okayama7\|eukprot:XP_001833928.2 hypothetical protein CC1G_01605 [Coprinopsis cinerea okayama7\
MPLDALPYDVKELILSALGSPKDLLRLALTSKSWKSLVIPHHIEYRLLRLDDHRPEVWKHLAEKRLLASRIRTVVLGPDYRLLPGVGQSQSSLYPRTLLSTPTSEAAQIKDVQVVREDVLQALRNMTSLVSFSLHLEYDPECPLQPLPGDPFAGKEIVQALKESKSLRKVSISDLGNKIFSCGLKHHEAEVGLEDVLWAFRDLEELSTTIPFPKLTAAVKAVQPMSNLRRLCIRPGTYHLSSDFLSYTFPHLHTFDLNVFPFGEPEVWDQPVIEFLSRHPTIEVLEWQTLYQTRPPRLSRTLLPNLKVIRSNHKLGSIFPSLEVMYLRPDQPGAFRRLCNDGFTFPFASMPTNGLRPVQSIAKGDASEEFVGCLFDSDVGHRDM